MLKNYSLNFAFTRVVKKLVNFFSIDKVHLTAKLANICFEETKLIGKNQTKIFVASEHSRVGEEAVVNECES